MRRIRKSLTCSSRRWPRRLCVPASGAWRQQQRAATTKIGKGEGKLTMIAWEGYLDAKWVKPFVKQTGCKIQPKYAGTSDEMVTLMRTGGGGQYDMVSASGDASLRLVYGKDVQPVNVESRPGLEAVLQGFQSPAQQHRRRPALRHLAAVGTEHAPLQHEEGKAGPDELVCDLQPQSTRASVTVPNNPIQIADVALYLSKTQPSPRDQRPI